MSLSGVIGSLGGPGLGGEHPRSGTFGLGGGGTGFDGGSTGMSSLSRGEVGQDEEASEETSE